jgi:hypothetical protein
MAIAFVVLHEHPETVKSITVHVETAIKQIEIFDGKGGKSCLSLLCCIPCILSRFGQILGLIDQKVGKLGVVKIAEFLSSIMEIFCKLTNIHVSMDLIVGVAHSIHDLVNTMAGALRPLFSKKIPDMNRKSKWAPLDIANTIRNNLAKFENKSAIVERTVNSFENVFKAVETAESSFEKVASNHHKTQSSTDSVHLVLASEVTSEHEAILNQVSQMGKFFQCTETIITYGILAISDEQHTLEKIMDNIDECSRILNKFAGLHIVYKVICGTKYLSKLSEFAANIINLLEHSNLKINSPGQFVSDLKRSYPKLLFMLVDSIVGDNNLAIKNILEAPKHLDKANQIVNDIQNNPIGHAQNAFNDVKKHFNFNF